MPVKLPYVHVYRDRHGRLRRYFRRRGFPKVALPGDPGSVEFHAAYSAALAACKLAPEPVRSQPGSISGAIAAYYTSSHFLAFADGTKKMRRAILERFRADHGDKRLAHLQRQHVAVLLSKRTPLSARNWLKTLRGLMQFAVEIGLRPDDPTQGIRPMRTPKSEGWHNWTEDEIEAYEARHPIGTRARLAMALMLYTGQRRSDAIRIGPQHIRDGILTITQQKTGTRLAIPVVPELAEIIARTECGNLAFLVTEYGKPFGAAGFGNLFREWCDQAGLPQCSAHGLRKAALRRLAEGGATGAQLRAIGGHKSLAQVEPYIAAADQRRLAESAIEKLRKK